MLKIVILPTLTLFLALSINVSAVSASPAIERLALKNNHIRVEATPDIGGRVVHFSRQDAPNFLRIGREVNDIPEPVVNAESNNIGYLGHEMWVGPQSAWWTQQTLNAARRKAKSVWPPDPFLVLSQHDVTQQNDKQIELVGPVSPISGIAFTKRYQLIKERPDSVRLDVIARNARSTPVSWDIWFNTRVRAEAKVYVPIQDEEKLRVNPFPGEAVAPPVYNIEQGLFSFELTAPPAGKTVRRGKVFIQPAAGWIAAFDHDQVFVIQFALQPESLIHPEQGQVELYLDYQPQNPDAGLMELEVHAPYRTLQPNEEMQAHEVWTVLPYAGDFTSEAHIDFLKRHAAALGLEGF